MLQIIVCPGLLVLTDIAEMHHTHSAHIDGMELFQPVGAGLLQKRLPEHGVQLLPIPLDGAGICIPGIVKERLQAQDRCDLLVIFLHRTLDEVDPLAVRAAEGSHVNRTILAGDGSRGGIRFLGDDIHGAHAVNRIVVKACLDQLALAVTAAAEQSCQDLAKQQISGKSIANTGRGSHRHIVIRIVQRAQKAATGPKGCGVKGGQLRIRTFLAKAQHQTVDQRRIFVLQRFVVQAVSRQRVGTQVGDKNIRPLQQLMHRFHTLRGLDIQRDMLFAAVVQIENGVVLSGKIADLIAGIPPAVALGLLDLNDLRAQIR